MPVLRVTAEGAVKALKVLNEVTITDRTNKHVFEKHGAKATAIAGGTETQQGWFEKVVTTRFSTSEEANRLLGDARKKKWGKRQGLNPRQTGGKLAANNKKEEWEREEFQHTYTDDIGMYGMPKLICSALKRGDYELYEGTGGENSFVFLTDLPSGYVGRSMRDGVKKKRANAKIAVAIVVGAANPQIISAYPTGPNWGDNQTLLV
jgi:hypothetical protein